MSFLDWFGPAEGAVPTNAPSPDTHHKLALYKYDACPYCRRVLKALQSIDVEIEMRDIQSSSAHRTELRKVTGRTTVPCLFIDGTPLFESLDIVAWLKAYEKAGAHAG